MTDNAAIDAICPICWETYDEISQFREVLPCGHMICSICLPNLEVRVCPQCRTPIDDTEGDFASSNDRLALVGSSDSDINSNTVNEPEDSGDTFRRICWALIIPCSTTNSKGTVILATAMFFFVMLICCLIRLPVIAFKLAESKWLCDNVMSAELAYSNKTNETHCATTIGNLIIYRVSFSYFLFLFFHCIVMLITPKNTVVFDQVRNGFWLLKWLILFGFLVSAFFVKNQSKEPMIVVGIIGGFALNVLQTWLVAHVGSDLNNRISSLFRNFLTFICYCVAWAYTLALMWLYADGRECALSRWLIGINVFLCLLLAIIKSCMQTERSGLLSVSLLTVFIMHLTWTALSNNPNKACNPLLIDFSHLTSVSTESIFLYMQIALSMIIMFACVVHAVLQRSMLEANFFVEVLFGGATLFAMMTLTNWSKLDGGLRYPSGHIEALWVKMASGWIGLLLSCCLFDTF